MSLDPIILIKTLGMFGIFAIVFAESGIFLGFFLPGDSLLFVAGVLASAGYLSFWPLLIGVIVCAILGDNVGYWFGTKVGHRIFFKDDSFFFNKKNIDRTKMFYEKYGSKTIILARFVPVVRTFAPILAGVGQMEYRTFFKYNLLGGLAWPLLLIPGGFFLGNVIPDIDRLVFPIVGLIIILSFLPVIVQFLKNR